MVPRSDTAFGLGFIIGPYIGGKLSSPNVSFYGLFDTPSWFGATTPFIFAGALSLMNCALIVFSFPETIKEKFHGGRLALGRSISNIRAGFTSDRLRVPLASVFFFNGGFTFFTSFFGVYLGNNFGFSASNTGDYFAFVGLFIAFSQAVLVRRVSTKLADYKVLRFSMFGLATMLAVFFVAPAGNRWWLFLPVPFFSAFNGLTMANNASLISRSAEMGKQGEAMGIYSSVQSLASVPASILLGYITSSITSAQPLIVASLCIATAGAIFVLFFRPKYVDDNVAVSAAPAAH